MPGVGECLRGYAEAQGRGGRGCLVSPGGVASKGEA